MGDRLIGKVAVVTGAASGIGEGTAEAFVAQGASVVLADLQGDAGRVVADRLGSSTRFIQIDVTAEDQVAAAVQLAVDEFGSLDIMFNNAGIVGATGSIAQTASEAWDRTIAILLSGVFFGTKHAARVMIEQGSGVILNTASTAGMVGGLGPHAYTAAKHAVVGLTRSTASELAQYGIRVNAIGPGNTATPMTSAVITGKADRVDAAAARIAADTPLGYAGMPADIANAAVFLASDEARYISAHCLMVDAGQVGGGMELNPFHQGETRLWREDGQRERF
ncbi:MAG: glucose 1-dehydrogenase [Acidobacteria bacterium]|nr:glucose 1-dehydrogenase [Acidobacteriota bacterium]